MAIENPGPRGVLVSSLTNSPAAGTNSLAVDNPLSVASRQLVGIGVGTTGCEIQPVQSVNGTTITLANNLGFGHNANDKVAVLQDSNIPFWWFGIVGDGTANDEPAIQQAAQGSLPGNGLQVDCQGRTMIQNAPVVRTDGSYFKNAIFKPGSGFAPVNVNGFLSGDPNGIMHVHQNGSTLSVTSGTNTLTTSAAHGMAAGKALMVKGTSLPPGLTYGQIYYACGISGNTFNVASTRALALANTPDITFASGWTGTCYCNLMVLGRIHHDNVQFQLNKQAGVHGLAMQLQQPAKNRELRFSNEAPGCFGLLTGGQDFRFDGTTEFDGAHLELATASIVDFDHFDCEVGSSGTDQTAPRVHFQTAAQALFTSQVNGGINGIRFGQAHHEMIAPLATTTVSGAGQVLSTTPADLAVASAASFRAGGGKCVVAGVHGLVTYTTTDTGANLLKNCTVSGASGTGGTATNSGTVADNVPYCAYDMEGLHTGIVIDMRRLSWIGSVKAGAALWIHTGGAGAGSDGVALNPYATGGPSSAGFLWIDDQDRAQTRDYWTDYDQLPPIEVAWANASSGNRWMRDTILPSAAFVKVGGVRPGQPLTQLQRRSDSTSASLIVGDSIQSGIATPTYSASITPDASAAPWQTITVTNGTAFTINAPLNPPTSTQTAVLTIETLNSSGGTMGAVTWNAAFVLVGGAFTNPASTKKRFVRFEWNGAKWVETSRASADY